MIRLLFAAAVLLAASGPALADRVPALPPAQRAVVADVVVVGTVTAVENDPIEIVPGPGSPAVAYTVAVVKVDTPLAGAGDLTHLQVGLPRTANRRPTDTPPPGLAKNQAGLFFLTRHPSGKFYTYSFWMSPPVDAAAGNYREQLTAVKRALAAVADPEKALTVGAAADRAFAAAILVAKYRGAGRMGLPTTAEKLPAAESRLILKALAEADWAKPDPNAAPAAAVLALGLTFTDGWKPPAPKPGGDYAAEMRKAFAAWVDGPGKDYRISKLVPKK